MGNGGSIRPLQHSLCTFSYMFEVAAYPLFGIKAELEQDTAKAEMMRFQWESLTADPTLGTETVKQNCIIAGLWHSMGL